MRAAIVSHTYIDPALRGKLRALAGLGCTVAALVPDRWEDSATGESHARWQADAGVQIIPVEVAGDADDLGGLNWSRRALRRTLKDFRPDVVQVEEEPWTRAAAGAVAESRRIRVPVVGFTSETIPRPLPFRLSLRKRGVLRQLRGIITANHLSESLVAASNPALARLVTPQTGLVAPVTTAPGNHDRFVIGFAGRLVPEKGLDVLLRAAVKLVGPWSLIVSGTGPAQEELEALAERLGIAARVRWLGAQPRDDRALLWPQLDCFVAPSRGTRQWVETLGPAVITAMAHGVPVVVARTGALPATVGEAGVVVPEDDPAALTEVLQRLMVSPADRGALAVAGRRRALQEFADEAIAQRTLEFWRSLRAE